MVANGYAKAGKRVLLIEKGHWGGDCTNFGCIPSKSLIASAHTAHAIRTAEELGIECKARFTSNRALERVREIVRSIRHEEEPPALKGVDTLEGMASFEDPHTLRVNGQCYTAKKMVIATGSSPITPSIKGLDQVAYLNNENVFDLKEIPKRLGIIGAGPIGCELGQAFQRLGSQVIMIEARPSLLLREEPEAQELAIETFRKEGIEVLLNQKISSIRPGIEIDTGGQTIQVDQLLIGAGRAPNIEALALEKAGITHARSGITVDRYGRTSQKHIYAIGDCSGGAPFTHMAEAEGRAVLVSLLAPFNKRFDHQPPPRCTFLDPEIASTGLLEKEAIAKYGKRKVASYFVPFTKIDRAITAGRTEGFIKVVTLKWSSKILGATIMGPRAGEIISEIQLAIRQKIPLRKLAQVIHPYPTYGIAVRKAADQWLTKTLLSSFRS